MSLRAAVSATACSVDAPRVFIAAQYGGTVRTLPPVAVASGRSVYVPSTLGYAVGGGRRSTGVSPHDGDSSRAYGSFVMLRHLVGS